MENVGFGPRAQGPAPIVDALHPDTRALVARLALVPHPEGGFYRETWRSTTVVATPGGPRSALTVILYLLPAGAVSLFHRIRSDEVWQHVNGDPLDLHVLEPSGAHEIHRLGPLGAATHAVVPAGHWQAARCRGPLHSLATCAVGPGFDFADLELADADDLVRLRPDLEPILRRLARAGAGRR